MATISEKISRISLRNKLAAGFTTAFLLLLGVSFYAIYELSAGYRQEEFYQRLRDRTLTVYKLIVEVEQIDHDMLRLFDINTINSLYEEKILLFDSSSHLVYQSIDNTDIRYASQILEQLKAGNEELHVSDNQFETLGIKFQSGNTVFYGIAKAYDRFGRSKLEFLKWILLITFVVGAASLVLLSFYLSRLITRPVTKLANEVELISADDLSMRVQTTGAKDEVGFLADKFNELLDRVERAFKFQYHFINHLSHELKTPLAVMMANTERALTEGDDASLKNSLQFQQHSLMELSHIINAMLDISLSETSMKTTQADSIRLDELLFECIDEITFLQNNIQFDFLIDDSITSSEQLTVQGNSRMLKMAIMNLLKNAVSYGGNEKPVVEIATVADRVILNIINDGVVLGKEEQEKLFRHLFRGSNSMHAKGFGLGLVLTQRIISLHDGSITYHITPEGKNCFSLHLPVAH